MTTKKTAGRKPIAPAPKVGPEFVGKTPAADAEREATVNTAVTAVVDGYSAERDLLNQVLGQALMSDAFAQFSRTVSVSKLAHVKETKIYRALRGMTIPHRAEKLTGTWEEFCELTGRSVDQVDRDISNLHAFGEEALESMSRMGIGYRDLRKLRALPDDSKNALIEVAKSGNKEALLELAEDLVAKSETERRKLADERDKALNQYEARETVIANNKKTIASLEEKLARIPKEKPDEKGKAMILEIGSTALTAAVEVAQLVKGAQMLLEHAVEHSIDDKHYKAAVEHHTTRLVEEIADLLSLCELAGLNSIPNRLRAALGVE